MMPLLEDPGMLIHPPMLLAGYMSWAVPYAFAIAALASGRLDTEWVRTTRNYAIFAWLILGIGNLLGAWWAYHVLGWGGYWGWDPVENAAILPWFVGTAYLHSVMIQERRGMLKVWTMALMITTFHLAIYGTFVVRSGLITSVHSFAISGIGPYFLGFLAFSLIGSLILLTRRLGALRSDADFDSPLSREGAFLLNNLLFLGITFATFLGSLFPLFVELVQGVRITVAKPYFEQVNGPMFLALIVLMGIGPLLPWRRASRQLLWKNFAPPVIATGLLTIAMFAAGIRDFLPLIALASCGFVAFVVGLEYYRGISVGLRAGRSLGNALSSMLSSNRRRYGGYIVHIAIILIGVAIIGSNHYQIEREVSLSPGESISLGRYTLTYNGLAEQALPDRRIVSANLAVSEDDRSIGQIEPARSFRRNFERQPTSTIVIRSDLREDLYVVLASWDAAGNASFFMYVNPLVMWLWIGGVVLLLGGLVIIWPESSPVRSIATSSVPTPAVRRSTAEA
jgi:cytochrome c-type biogenesis protein CcmF